MRPKPRCQVRVFFLYRSIQVSQDATQSLCSGFVFAAFGKSLLIFLLGSKPVAFRFVGAAQIHVRVTVGLVSRGFERALEPGDRTVDIAFLHEVSADVVIGITKRRVDLDRLMTLGDRIVDTSHQAVGPAEKRIRLRRRMHLDRLFVELDGFVKLALDLVLVSLLEKTLGTVLFVSSSMGL